MLKPTKEEHAAHLRAGNQTCLVCEKTISGAWTDYNGQIRCGECGTTYQILGSHLSDEFLAEIGLAKEEVAKSYCDCFQFVPILREYYRETGRLVPFGSYFGGSPIPEKDYTDFYGWVAQNADAIRPEWEEDFNWDSLLEKYAVKV